MINLLEKLLYCNIKASDIFKKTSEEDIEKRNLDYFNEIIIPRCTKNPDGTYNCDSGIFFHGVKIVRFPIKFKKVRGSFECANCDLVTLEGAPDIVTIDFACYNNNLTTLKGGPKKVGRDCYCNNNKLTTLEGAPEEVGSNFNCSFNKLKTLEYAPKRVGGVFNCAHNKLVSLKGASKNYIDRIYCDRNPTSIDQLLQTI